MDIVVDIGIDIDIDTDAETNTDTHAHVCVCVRLCALCTVYRCCYKDRYKRYRSTDRDAHRNEHKQACRAMASGEGQADASR